MIWFFFAVLWTVLGIRALIEGDTEIGAAQVGLGALNAFLAGGDFQKWVDGR